MAELPEVWTEKTPERPGLFERTSTFGVARDAELVWQQDPVDDTTTGPAKPRREHGPFLTHLFLPWSYGDAGSPVDRWHRLRCRLGRHVMVGGHAMQIGSAVIFVERRCRWCGPDSGELAEPVVE